MTEEIIIDECFNCKKKKDIGDNWRTCKLKCSYKYKRKENDYITRLEQENKSLYEEKNCLHKIIDRLLENAGYSKDIASAEDFEDVYEDMQRKVNELAELEQENKELKEYSQRMENQRENYYKEYNKYRSALEEIRENLVKLKTNDEDDFTYEYSKIEDKINGVLNNNN